MGFARSPPSPILPRAVYPRGRAMRKQTILAVAVGVALGLATQALVVSSQEDGKKAPPPPHDAVTDAQTPRPAPANRPEQKKNAHDRSDVFQAAKAPVLTAALNDQPKGGDITGFDFYRDPLNADRPMMTFAEVMRQDVAEKPKVMDMQRKLLEKRYDLKPRLDPEAKMSRGKPLPVGPTARLPEGMNWEALAALAPADVRKQGAFPYPSLPHPKQTTG